MRVICIRKHNYKESVCHNISEGDRYPGDEIGLIYNCVMDEDNEDNDYIIYQFEYTGIIIKNDRFSTFFMNLTKYRNEKIDRILN